MYKTIVRFLDLQDGHHVYDVGDVFPRDGMVVSDDRLEELASKKNKRKIPLIEKVKDAEPKIEKEVESEVDAEEPLEVADEPEEESVEKKPKSSSKKQKK